MEASLISNLPIHRKLSDGINFFFAALPDERARGEIAEMAERFRKSHRVSGTAVGVDNLHLLLCPMGRPDRLRLPLEGALAAAAAAVQANAFELALDSVMRLSARDGAFPFALCADGVSAESALKLRRAIAEAQAAVGLQVTGVSSFMPHVELLRGPLVDAIQETVLPIRWCVSEFVLIRSFFGQSRHEVIERWSLTPLAPPLTPEPLADFYAELDRNLEIGPEFDFLDD